MWKHLFKLAMVIAFCCEASIAARASTFYMYFEIRGFPISNGNHAPTDPVIGSIVWEAAGIHDPIQAFDSINLTLDGHVYSIFEIGIAPPNAGFPCLIGGTLNSTPQINYLTDDFCISWDPNSLAPHSFDYSSSKRSGIWDVRTSGFSAFSITPVPEPCSITLMALGALYIGCCRSSSKIRKFRHHLNYPT